MHKTTCYIINFNAKDYLLSCIESVIEAIDGMNDIELCIVDNASTDGSLEAVHSLYGTRVRCISNTINLGGAGGFNTALKDAIEKSREFAVLLDNDIRVEKLCISHMIEYLKQYPDVGAVGAKIMIMDNPDFIQEFGGHLDMENYYFRTDYWYEKDDSSIKDIESEWLSSCALSVRVDAAIKTHLFPEENFLYWDDIQFTWEIRKAGYRLISLANAKIWHKGKKKTVVNTAQAYYAMRNRTKFFSLCEKEDKIDVFCKTILEKYFEILFGSSLKGLYKINSSRIMALDDFVHKRYGKIPEEALWSINSEQDRITELCSHGKKVFIKEPSISNPSLNTTVYILKEKLTSVDSLVYAECEDNADIVFVPCEHISEVRDMILPQIWVDKWMNCILSENDFQQIKAFPYMKRMFVELNYEWLMKGIIKERSRVR